MDQCYKESQLYSCGIDSSNSTKNKKRPTLIKLESELTQASGKSPKRIITSKRSRSHSSNKDNEYNRKRARYVLNDRDYREHRNYSIKNHVETSLSSEQKEGQNYYAGYGKPTYAMVRKNSYKIKSCNGEQSDTKRKEIAAKINGQSSYGKQILQPNNYEEIKGQNQYDKGMHFTRREELQDIKIQNSQNICRKPCWYFNWFGKCHFSSGHYPRSGGFTKQLHICSCCHEFLNEDRFHSAVDCHLKKKICTILNSPKANLDIANSKLPGMPCNSFNFGKCVLKSGHCLRRTDIKALHICNFCFKFGGERKYHSQEECMLKKKLIIEVENDCQPIKDTRYDQVERNSLKERTDRKFICGEQTVKVLPKLSKAENLKEPGQLKSTSALDKCLIKGKICKDSEKYALVESKMNKDLQLLEQEATTKPQFDIKDKVKNIVKQTLYSYKKMKTEELNSETSIFPKIEIKDEVPHSERNVKNEVKSEIDIYFTSDGNHNCNLKVCTNAEYFEMEDAVKHIYIKNEGSYYTEERDLQSSVVMPWFDNQEVEADNFICPHPPSSIQNYNECPDTSSKK